MQLLVTQMMGILQNRKQVAIAQLKQREVAEEYIGIEQNTQYLTNIVRYTSKKQKKIAEFESLTLDMRSLLSICTQISYLFYTCYVRKMAVWISHRLYILHPTRKQYFTQICLQYFLPKQYYSMKVEEQRIVDKYFKLYDLSINNHLIYTHSVLQRLKDLIQIGLQQQPKIKINSDKIYIKQLHELKKICYQYLLCRNITNPRVAILSLQESQIFREYSNLVKIMNNSIFTAIKYSQSSSLLADISNQEIKLANSKLKSKPEHFCKDTEYSIEKMMLGFVKNGVLTIEQSVNVIQNEQKTSQQKQAEKINPIKKQHTLGDITGSSFQERRYICKILLIQKPYRQFNQGLFSQILQQSQNRVKNYKNNLSLNTNKNGKQKLPLNQFIIQYIPSKGLIVVKYLTNFELTIENTDLLMFHCNNFGFHLSSVMVQVCQKGDPRQQKKKQRYISFKCTNYLSLSDNPLFKILLMMDLTMICAKITQPFFKKIIMRGSGGDLDQIQGFGIQIDHAIQIFLKKVEKYYRAFKNLYKQE